MWGRIIFSCSLQVVIISLHRAVLFLASLVVDFSLFSFLICDSLRDILDRALFVLFYVGIFSLYSHPCSQPYLRLFTS